MEAGGGGVQTLKGKVRGGGGGKDQQKPRKKGNTQNVDRSRYLEKMSVMQFGSHKRETEGGKCSNRNQRYHRKSP